MRAKIINFFSNGGYATWFQSLIVVVSVAIAYYAIKEGDTNLAVANSVSLAQKYFTDKPTLATANLRLRVSQYGQVQEAKKAIPGYDRKSDPTFDQLFEIATPLVSKAIAASTDLQNDFFVLNDFFSGLMICVGSQVCDRQTAVKLLGYEALGFYNAVCPYMESLGEQFGVDEDSPRYAAFLVNTAGYKNAKIDYFCRSAATRQISAKAEKKE